jgi:hypothetical protein
VEQSDTLEKQKCLLDSSNEHLQALSSFTVSTLPPTPWARVSFSIHKTSGLHRWFRLTISSRRVQERPPQPGRQERFAQPLDSITHDDGRLLES